MNFTLQQIEWMGREVKRQKADATFVAGMALALDYVDQAIGDKGYLGIADIHNINACVMLGVNNDRPWGFRKTPVTFQNGGGSCAPDVVPQATARIFEAVHPDGLTFKIDPDEIDPWIKQFLWIHPYEDGNGRTASILRNWMMGTLDNPTDLPDYNW